MDRFILDYDEEIEKQCGEICLTTKGRISIHCTLCEDAYCGFESYQAHLYEVHLFTHFKIEIGDADTGSQSSTTSTKYQIDEIADIKETTTDFQIEVLNEETEQKCFLTNTATEAEPINELASKETDILAVPKNTLRQPVKDSSKKEFITEFNIPAVVREVVKRKVYIAKTTPEEDRKHKCPICGLGFKEKGNMRHHLRRHSDEKNHACTDCDKRFYSSTELNTHIKSHTHEKPLLCTECGETFATKSTLGGHLKRHRGQKDYSCQHPGCGKRFYTATYLKNHMLSHSQERRVKCTICTAKFKQRTALKNHLKLHENKLEYECQICEAKFNQKAGLFSHMKTVHTSV